MTVETGPNVNGAKNLAGVFKAGRISDWVDRNRPLLDNGDLSSLELGLLGKLSPGFAEATKELTAEAKIEIIREALDIADSSPLSATRF